MAQVPVITPDEDSLTVFTDDSCLPRPRRGGIGIRFVRTDSIGKEQIYDHLEPGFTAATVNQMELQAVIRALRLIQSNKLPQEMLDSPRKIDIVTDSRYVSENLKNALYEWPRERWMRRSGAPVANAELWKELTRDYKKVAHLVHLELRWGKGHSGSNPHNKAADRLAKASARQASRAADPSLTVRRRTSSKATEPGSIAMLGQRLRIRIITANYMRVQQLYRYRYEVVSRSNAHYGRADFAVSSDPRMRPGHTYSVTMGTDQENPTIAKMHREITKPALANDLSNPD